MTEIQRNLSDGPGKFELMQTLMHMLDPQNTLAHVSFTLGDAKRTVRGGKITSIREADDESGFNGQNGYLLIEGYLFNGKSPYKHHGTPFSAMYNPTLRTGWMKFTE